MRYKNPYLVSDSVWQLFLQHLMNFQFTLLIFEDPYLLHTTYISSSYSFLPLILRTPIFIHKFHLISICVLLWRNNMNQYFKTSDGKYLATDQEPMGEFILFYWHDAIIVVVHFIQL